MKSHHSPSRRLVPLIVAPLLLVACVNSHESSESVAAAVAVEQKTPTINHVSPARDSVGGAPTRFEWTAVQDADQYAIGVWDEVDRLVWRTDHVRGTSVTAPKDVKFEFGTYFWSVTALREDHAIAESGRSAFVVTQ